MNYSTIPAEALNIFINTIDGERLRLASFISLTTREAIQDFHYTIINEDFVSFWFTTSKNKFTLITTAAGSYFLEE